MPKKQSHTIYLLKHKNERVPTKWPYADWELSCQDVNLIYLVCNEKRLDHKEAKKRIREIDKFRKDKGFGPSGLTPIKVTITFEDVPVKRKSKKTPEKISE
jgi:hypothetical protein